MLALCSLASGSKGNAVLIVSGKSVVLLDDGLSYRTLEQRMSAVGLRPSDLCAVLLTHRHTDHVAGLGTLLKKHRLDIYTHDSNVGYLAGAAPAARFIPVWGADFFINDITVSPLGAQHDVHCFGYSFYCGGSKISVLTDSGTVKKEAAESLRDSHFVMLESNHDPNMLAENRSYPKALKDRIASPRGHLSNGAAADEAAHLAKSGVRHILLAHLSEQNNTPELALCAARAALDREGMEIGRDVFVDVATQHCPTKLYKVS
ncbi:MAG: MBL fold metallo-hydrolase [Firmicutes bacterium]|nr:MBL fold metallo-hydrolase [Bacillota bacterium]